MVESQILTCISGLATNTAPERSYLSSPRSSWLSQHFTLSLPSAKASSRDNNNNNKSPVENTITTTGPLIRPTSHHAKVRGRKWELRKKTFGKNNPDWSTQKWMEFKGVGKENSPVVKCKEESGNVRRPRQTSSQSPIKIVDTENTQKFLNRTLSSTFLSSTFPLRTSPSPSFKKKHNMIPKPRIKASPVVSRSKYQDVLTKYYKTKKAEKYLMENFKIVQSKDTFEGFIKEAAALCEPVPVQQDEAQIGFNSKQAQDQGTFEGSFSYSHPLLQDELIQKMATIISEPALRPTVFQVPRKSPPDNMLNMMETLSKSGQRCITCGKRFPAQ